MSNAKKPKYFQGYFKCNHPEKYMGDPKTIVYRSGWEFKVMRRLDNSSDITRWSSEEFSITYCKPSSRRIGRYYPDFFVERKDGRKEVWEIKPYRQTLPPKKTEKKKQRRFLSEVLTFETNQAKWKAAREWCEDRGIKFKVLTERDI